METNNFEYDDLVKNIRNIISTKGFKQGAIAKKANFTDSEFSNMLNDRRKLIRAEYLPQIAHALDVDVNELFRKWGEDRELLKQIQDKYPDVILPAFNVIPMCWVDEQMGTAYKRKRRPPKE